MMPRWFALGVVIAALAGIAGITACGIRPPDVSGMDLEAARAVLSSAGVTLGRVSYETTSAGATWTVVAQSPRDRVDEGTAIDLVLVGPPPVEVPDLRGAEETAALALITEAELALGSVTATYHESVPASGVLEQSPAAGAVVTAGTRVDLATSKGRRPPPSESLRLRKVRTLTGPYSPKSVVAGQEGHVFAQNMIYRHTVTVFDDSDYSVVKTIPDKVVLADFGFGAYTKAVRGGPVEAAMTPDRRHIYVSNYSMYGPGFSRPGDDKGSPSSGIDPSFVYRIPTDSLKIDQVIKVGSVPKFLAVTPDGRYLIVSNWISYSVSIVDVQTGRELRQVRLGAYPRGVVVDPGSRIAYVAVMGSSDIAKVDLSTFAVTRIRGVGPSPRHLNISPDGATLYATLNGNGTVVKIDARTGKVVDRISTGRQPRSMTIAEDGGSLYVVNYESDSVSKIRTSDMAELQEIAVPHHPIGITYVNETREVWVACYSGSIMVFRDE